MKICVHKTHGGFLVVCTTVCFARKVMWFVVT